MSLWKNLITVEEANQLRVNTLADSLSIDFIEVGDDFVKATMPVDTRTHQPMGILHGGASVALAETVGSFAAQMAAEPGYYCVGLDINANHLKAVRSGLVTGVATAVHIGRSTQVWEINIYNESEVKVCVSRLTMSVLKL